MKNQIATGKSLAYVLVSAVSLIVGWVPVVYSADGGIEEIVVTARYREEELQDTPLAITAITADDIEAQAISSSYEIAYTVPNASFRPAQAAFGNTMTAFIRGIGQNDFDFAFEPGVGIYVDDVYNPFTMGSQIDLLDLERVEVLRGPQGTLFGRGSIGGAVRYVSKKPMGDNTGFITVTAGEYDRIDVRAGYDFSIIENTLFARVTGSSKSRDGHQKVLDFACAEPVAAGFGDGIGPDADGDGLPDAVAVGGPEDMSLHLPVRDPNRGKDCKLGTQGGEDVVGARGQVRWLINDRVEANFAAEYMNDSSEVRADSLIQVAPLTPAFQTWSDFYLGNKFGVAFDDRFVPDSPYVTYATYDDQESGLSFTPETSLEKSTFSGKLDVQLTDAILGTVVLAHMDASSEFATDADQSPVNEQLVNGRETLRTDTAEIRFSGRAWDRMDWTVGGFFYDGRAVNNQVVSIPAFIFAGVFGGVTAGGAPPVVAAAVAADVIDNAARFLVNARNEHDAENQSGFGHMVFDLTEAWRLTGGVRYSHDAKDVDFDNTIVATTINLDDTHFDWKVGLDYQFNEDIMAYGSISTGYRPESYNPRPFQVTQAVAVDGEEQTAFELGLKADLFERKVRVNVAGFYSDYGQRITPVGGIECLVDGNGNYIPDDPAIPGSITDALGNVCDSVTSRTFYENTPADISGAEVEVTWKPTDPFTLSGTFGWTNWDSPDITTALGAVTDRPSYVPETNWSVAASYDFSLGNGSTVTPRFDVYGQSEICFSPFSEISCVDGYELVNFRIEWVSPEGAWTAAAGVSNLTDTDYFLNSFDLSLFGQPTTEAQPGRPQEWYLQFSRKF